MEESRLEKKCLDGQELTQDEALDLAGQVKQPVSFSETHGSEADGFSGSVAGTAYPCGCLQFSTVLSDGSLGWGGWDESCFDHMNN